jgi:medium-chain acyl-[acyl-carrier-protein] hydrolase
MHVLDTPQFIEEVQRRYGGIPPQVLEEEDLCALLLPMLRADITMMETYSYIAEPPLQTAISVFGGLEDRVVAESSLAGWRQQTEGEFCLRMYPGNHFFPQSAEADLPECITADLVRVRANTHI